jgi:hypothetical protein
MALTVHRLDPATHVGPRSYISPQAQLPDGRSHLDRTADTVIALIRACRDSTAATDDAGGDITARQRPDRPGRQQPGTVNGAAPHD